jgi:hypothetical protein
VFEIPSEAREPYDHEMTKADEFIVGTGIDGYDVFFEQDDATGYFYLADASGVLYALHIYNRKPSIGICEDDVRVVWTESGERCGVLIHGKLCEVIGINGDQCRPAHVLDSHGIIDPKWTKGFALFNS